MTAGSAWYAEERVRFVQESVDKVVGQLASNAAQQGLHVESEQHEEWRSSVGILKAELMERVEQIELLRTTLSAPELAEYRHVILEYDFRRRGLRIDCVLLGNGIVAVVEFKRSQLSAADREQVTGYCVNLVEFHEETRRATAEDKCIVAPILALTSGRAPTAPAKPQDFHRPPWKAVLRHPIACDQGNLQVALGSALDARRKRSPIDCRRWLGSRFSPSSTILDAAISLYGQHDVSAISDHAAPVELIERCTAEVGRLVEDSLRADVRRIVFVSGAPGAGKTLVGLKLAFDPRFRDDAVFVTGNAPLVDVLSAALQGAYRARSRPAGKGLVVPTGYSREDVQRVISMATFKLVKAHAFLGRRGGATGSTDGRVVVFDEAQRTYQAGREVMRQRLPEDEAVLILDSLERSYGSGVVVALVGHKQAINRGELGISAWLKAAKDRNWRYAVADETLALAEIGERDAWACDPLRDRLELGHLPHSLRYYRNEGIERWVDALLGEDASRAARLAAELDARGDTVWLVRELAEARAWVKERRVGEERAGIVASGQARRLAAEGLFVEHKPDIARWMLAPAGDFRSASMLETVQNQYQIQGLEIDHAIVCWDLDLRREGERWTSYKLSGADWKRDKALEIAKNGYRVLLTRARKGMIVFVPRGDLDGVDLTRPRAAYDRIADHLLACGARPWLDRAR